MLGLLIVTKVKVGLPLAKVLVEIILGQCLIVWMNIIQFPYFLLIDYVFEFLSFMHFGLFFVWLLGFFFPCVDASLNLICLSPNVWHRFIGVVCCYNIFYFNMFLPNFHSDWHQFVVVCSKLAGATAYVTVIFYGMRGVKKYAHEWVVW